MIGLKFLKYLDTFCLVTRESLDHGVIVKIFFLQNKIDFVPLEIKFDSTFNEEPTVNYDVTKRYKMSKFVTLMRVETVRLKILDSTQQFITVSCVYFIKKHYFLNKTFFH